MNLRILNVLGIFLFSCMMVTLAVKRRAVVEFTKVECINENPDLVQINCYANRTSQNISAVYVNFTLSENVNKVNGLYSVSVKLGNKFVNISTGELNYCEILNTAYSYVLLKVVVADIRSVSNFPLYCPYVKNNPYIVNGFRLDTTKVPSYLPLKQFKLVATFDVDQRPAIRFIVSGQFENK